MRLLSELHFAYKIIWHNRNQSIIAEPRFILGFIEKGNFNREAQFVTIDGRRYRMYNDTKLSPYRSSKLDRAYRRGSTARLYPGDDFKNPNIIKACNQKVIVVVSCEFNLGKIFPELTELRQLATPKRIEKVVEFLQTNHNLTIERQKSNMLLKDNPKHKRLENIKAKIPTKGIAS